MKMYVRRMTARLTKERKKLVLAAVKYIRYCHSFHHIISFCLQQNIIFQFTIDWQKCQSITAMA